MTISERKAVMTALGEILNLAKKETISKGERNGINRVITIINNKLFAHEDKLLDQEMTEKRNLQEEDFTCNEKDCILNVDESVGVIDSYEERVFQ